MTSSPGTIGSIQFFKNKTGEVEQNFMSNPGMYIVTTHALEDPALDASLAKFMPKVSITVADAVLQDPDQDALVKLFHIAGFDYYDDGGNFLLPSGQASNRVFRLNRPLTRLGVRVLSRLGDILKPVGVAVVATASGEIRDMQFDIKALRPGRNRDS